MVDLVAIVVLQNQISMDAGAAGQARPRELRAVSGKGSVWP
jgi:hypothetical protein